MVRFLRAWLPAILWAGVIFVLSTDAFSAEHTARVLAPLIRWLFPHISAHQIGLIHRLIRKSAHFTEYFIFCMILFRCLRGQRTGWRWSWGLGAWFLAAGYSILDEIHQAFVVSRVASPYDSLLDTSGAFAAFLVLALWFRRRRTLRTGESSAESANAGALRETPITER